MSLFESIQTVKFCIVSGKHSNEPLINNQTRAFCVIGNYSKFNKMNSTLQLDQKAFEFLNDCFSFHL